MKTTVSVNGSEPLDISSYSDRIAFNLNLLRSFQGSNKSEHLKQDIRIYEYILNCPDSETLAKNYFLKKDEFHQKGIFDMRKIDIVKTLGWDVQ